MSVRIAVVGLGLRYPDADNTTQFWENILSGRRAFRDLPDERMKRSDYWAADPAAPDRYYSHKAAVLRNFEFDRAHFKISGPTYRSTDMTHWLALTVAAEAWADAGLPADVADRTAVVIGNTLTGEFSRANTMRLRWPYVRRVVGNALEREHWDRQQVSQFLNALEPEYKAPFPPVTEDTLAGGLSNTIAGRICNYFDFRGGGYTVDGACSSSIISVVTAARSLCEGTIDAAIAGGVDLSIDPFEVIGFAKTSALATGTMKVYDEDSNGFWPGEGCGMVVLMREADAHASGLRVYATITGWGITSDGHGGITRPEVDGHVAAIRQAYAGTGYPVASVDYFEGHGTGTAVGDQTEIRAISTAIRESGTGGGNRVAALGSVKANIGHTKAAAGVAGLIKATLALHHGVIPPATGTTRPSKALERMPVHLPATALAFSKDRPARAGVSAMGFGGSNAHVALESASVQAGASLAPETLAMVAGRQDAELLAIAAQTPDDLVDALDDIARRLGRLSMAEYADLAADLARDSAALLAIDPAAQCRAAVVARSPEEAIAQLGVLVERLRRGDEVSPGEGACATLTGPRARVGFLFPGQGSGSTTNPFLVRRFPNVVKATFDTRPGSIVDTHIAQPRIATDSAHALAVLRRLGVEATAAVGHSLGELTALHWAGVFDSQGLADVAALRGEIMATLSTPGGTMIDVNADRETVQRLLDEQQDGGGVVACLNAPDHTVASGDPVAVAAVASACARDGIATQQLRVSHAFHSPHVDAAARGFGAALTQVRTQRPSRTVISTLTGFPLAADTDLTSHLTEQMRRPVALSAAVRTMADAVDLMIEVGPGRTLSSLAALNAPGTPALALDSDAESAAPFLAVMGAVWTFGVVDDLTALFSDRVVRELPAEMTFLASPCESAPQTFAGTEPAVSEAEAAPHDLVADARSAPGEASLLNVLCEVVAAHAELPLDAIGPDMHPLDDLHLSSITVSQLAAETARRVGRGALPTTTSLATVTLRELAEALETVETTTVDTLEGAAIWVRPFQVVARPVEDGPVVRIRRPGQWRVVTDVPHSMRDRIAEELNRAEIGSGVLAIVGGEDDGARTVLRAAQEVAGSTFDTLVVLRGPDDASGAAAMAKSFALEYPHKNCLVLQVPNIADPLGSLKAIAEEVALLGTETFREIDRSTTGQRTEPRLALWARTGVSDRPLAVGDLLLASGGAKGIVAESVITLASRWGVVLGLFGRASEHEDKEVRETLARLRDLNVRHAYVRADAADADQVQAAVQELEREFGPTRGILHGAGNNSPTSLQALTDEDLQTAARVKVEGLHNMLAAVDVDQLRLLVCYASIIGRAGLHGEAHYAVANDRLTAVTERFAREHPHVRTRSLERSVWEGTGMGVRLGVLESLARNGITPLPISLAVDALVTLVEDPTAPTTLVVASRLGNLPTARCERSTVPLLRFLESVKVDYPGIELVTDAELSTSTDLYFADHELDGDYLFPAALGIEAMTEVAQAVTGREGPFTIAGAEFLRPITVRRGEATRLRLAALVREDQQVEVVLRSSETSMSVDHFRATLVAVVPYERGRMTVPDTGSIEAAHLYGSLFFQGPRFQRVQRYRHVGAYEAVAELAVSTHLPWFATHLPNRLVLGDPGTRDAVMHAIQCCVPDAVLLPVGVERIRPYANLGDRPVLMHAQERSCEGDDHWYDVRVVDQDGRLLEEWQGLHLRAVRHQIPAVWESAMLGPHLQRTWEELGLPYLGVAVAVNPDRASGSATAANRAAGKRASLHHGADGRPLFAGSAISISHVGTLSLAVVAAAPVGCDIDEVRARDEATWSSMLGIPLWEQAHRISAAAEEPIDVSATRVWSALECLRKIGQRHSHLSLGRIPRPGWIAFTAPGGVEILTGRFTVTDIEHDVIVAVTTSAGLPAEEPLAAVATVGSV